MRGNRRMNHAIHMAAVTQTDCKNSDGRAYYQRKLAEGKTPAEARRALKRKISNTIYARLLADARKQAAGPGGQPGNDSASSAAGSHPARQLFGQDCECVLRPRCREREWRRACGPPMSVWLGSARPWTRLTLESSYSGVPRLRREREYQSLLSFRAPRRLQPRMADGQHADVQLHVVLSVPLRLAARRAWGVRAIS